MATFRNVLERLDYSPKQINAIGKMLLITTEQKFNAFVTFKEFMNNQNEDVRVNRWVSMMKSININPDELPTMWQQKNIWQNETIVNDVLDHEFNLSPYQVFLLLVCITQFHFIISSRFKIFSGMTNVYEKNRLQVLPLPMIMLIVDLGFTQERCYTTSDGPVRDVFLHAATGMALAQRIDKLKDIVLLQESNVKVYYLTNPRGLGKSESETAEILATWFTQDPYLILRITKHIQKIFKDPEVKYDWFTGLNHLKQIILDSVNNKFHLGLKEFPSAPNNEIYPAIYDETAKLDGNRDPFNNQWPHAGHLLMHLARKARIPLEKIEFVVIPVQGIVNENGRYQPAQTKDLITAYLKETADNLDENTLFAISDNSVSYGAQRQDIMLKLLTDHLKTITYHDAISPNLVDFDRVAKEIAAQFYTYYECDKALEERLNEIQKMQDNVRFNVV